MGILETLLTYIFVSMCAASISFTVTITGIFEGMREWIYKKNDFFGKLFTCPWCFSHYVVAIIFACSYHSIPMFPIFEYRWMNVLFTLFLILTMVGYWHKMLLLGYEPVQKIKAQRLINKLKEEKLKENV